MAAEKDKKPRRRKQPETVREHAQKGQAKREKGPKRKKLVRVTRPLSRLRVLSSKEYYPVKLPDSRIGRFMGKRRRLIPRYFRESWQELREVTWPTRKQTAKLTVAVFVFAVIFAVIIRIIDYGFDQVLRRVILG